MITRAGREMEVKTTEFKKWDYWYDGQCTGKKTSQHGNKTV